MLWKRGARFLAEGPELSRKLIRLGAPASAVRLNPIIINTEKYPKRIRPLKSGPRLNFLLIGRFVEKKGFHIFLEAVAKLRTSLHGFRVTIIGSGPMENRYREIIQYNFLTDQVSFEGRKTLAECMTFMLEADALVHASVTASNGDSEGGAPTIIIEAQAIGIPVICSDHADIPFIMGYTDFMAKEGDVDDLARLIRAFASDTTLPKKIEAGRKKVTEQHDMNVSRYYINVLNEFNEVIAMPNS